MKVSVLLCVFNGQNSIERAIKSILNQDFREFELLIINDGSNDKTEDIINKYLQIDPRIRYFYKEHSGLTNSLIYGLQEAKGEWIARIDADDYSKNNRISTQLKLVENNKNVVLVGSNFSLMQENRRIYKSNLPLKHIHLIYNLKGSKGFFPHSSAFFLRKKAIEIGGYRASFTKAQDHDLWLRLSEIGEIACCKENLVLIYDHQDRVTRKSSGYPQYIYAFAAIVSYFARQKKVYEIESKINNDDIHHLLATLSKYISNSKYCEIELFKQNLKILLTNRNKFYFLIKFISLLIRQRNIILLILKNIFLRKNLAYRFFLEYSTIL